MTEAAPWVKRAEEALDGRPSDPNVVVLRGQRPAVLDGDGGDALVAPLLAAFLWAAAIFRDTQAGHTDPIGLLLRWLALGLSVRALRLVHELLRRLVLWSQAGRYGLAITDEGLLLRTPQSDIPVSRNDLLDAREQGDWRGRSGRRFHSVYLTLRPETGRLFVAIPPVLDETSGLLAERLMRWALPTPSDEAPQYPAPNPLPSKVYDAAAQGEAPAGVVATMHGLGWVARGPYFTVLLGLVLLERWLAIGEPMRMRLGVAPVALIATCLLLVPAVWFIATRRSLAPRKGLSLVATPSELLMRTQAGIHRIAWQSLRRVSIESHKRWSILTGNRAQRSLVIERANEPVIRYEEIFLGVPAEVMAAVIEAYKRGKLPGSAAPLPTSDAT